MLNRAKRVSGESERVLHLHNPVFLKWYWEQFYSPPCQNGTVTLTELLVCWCLHFNFSKRFSLNLFFLLHVIRLNVVFSDYFTFHEMKTVNSHWFAELWKVPRKTIILRRVGLTEYYSLMWKDKCRHKNSRIFSLWILSLFLKLPISFNFSFSFLFSYFWDFALESVQIPLIQERNADFRHHSI